MGQHGDEKAGSEVEALIRRQDEGIDEMKFTVGVFPALINDKAFLDKVVVSIRGSKRDVPMLDARQTVNRAIGGTEGKYARLEKGVLASTGNSYDLLYGRMRLGKILPSLMLTIHSDGAPVTVEEIQQVIEGYCRKGWRASISMVELTLDLAGVSTEWLRMRVFSSAHKFASPRDDSGLETHYIGGRTSPWQGKIYQKTKDVVRLEHTLRRPFLRQHGITDPTELEKLRTLDFSRHLWLREINKDAVESMRRGLGETRRRFLDSGYRNLYHQEFVRAAKESFRAVPSQLVMLSPLEKQLQRMQSRLVV